jgi:hypothetical protein
VSSNVSGQPTRIFVDPKNSLPDSEHRVEELSGEEEEDTIEISNMAAPVANVQLNPRYCKHSLVRTCMPCVAKAYYGDSLSCWPCKRSAYMDNFRDPGPPSLFLGNPTWINSGRVPLQLNFCAHQPWSVVGPHQGPGLPRDFRRGTRRPRADLHDPGRNYFENFIVDNFDQISRRFDRMERILEERLGAFEEEFERLNEGRVEDMRRRLARDFAA